MSKARPKTGEKRQCRQPLKIDRLPQAMHDRIMVERAFGRTWGEIESLSPEFKEWEEAKPEAARLFPGKRLPHSNLQRWYDLRVEQVRQEVLAKAERARAIALEFSRRGFKELPAAVRSALGDQIFALMEAADEGKEKQFRKELIQLGRLLNQERRLDIAQQHVDVEKDKLSLVTLKVKGLKNDVEKKRLTPAELQKRLDEIYGIAEG
jgi:hypothetical protein